MCSSDLHATREELIEADEVGGKIADAIIDYFADAENLRIIERLRKAGTPSPAWLEDASSAELEDGFHPQKLEEEARRRPTPR